MQVWEASVVLSDRGQFRDFTYIDNVVEVNCCLAIYFMWIETKL